jgi:hypothetical protein
MGSTLIKATAAAKGSTRILAMALGTLPSKGTEQQQWTKRQQQYQGQQWRIATTSRGGFGWVSTCVSILS